VDIIKKYIITGAPSTGKTSIIKELKAKGYNCLNEVSREIIKKEQENNKKGTPWQDIERFTCLVFDKTKKELEQENNYLFSDRSLIDNIAYLSNLQKKVPSNLNSFPFKKYYHNIVFFAPIWEEIFVQDKQRLQTFEEAKKISKKIREAYKISEFKIILLPFVSSKERADFIISTINKKI